MFAFSYAIVINHKKNNFHKIDGGMRFLLLSCLLPSSKLVLIFPRPKKKKNLLAEEITSFKMKDIIFTRLHSADLKSGFLIIILVPINLFIFYQNNVSNPLVKLLDQLYLEEQRREAIS
ncbi:hypothetical protein BpHYR1_015725 [Brachionus plicatilis]|uniref:Uncharacterized protein n=1 Tax=Brachionus plicatilis TaxID=10195 RepID=A0A3M7RPH8_BRAPC|nr:hypothetical protein BpHYR1_015725 [Brachionus plicatilis]